jgi:hypothetical protein
MTEIISLSMPPKLKKIIDNERGLVPRSKYIVQKLEIIFNDTQKQENFDSSDSITAEKQEKESDESIAST